MNEFTSWECSPLYLSPKQVSRILGLSKGATYGLFHQQNFGAISIGRRLLVSRESLIRWLKEQEKHASDIYAD